MHAHGVDVTSGVERKKVVMSVLFLIGSVHSEGDVVRGISPDKSKVHGLSRLTSEKLQTYRF